MTKSNDALRVPKAMQARFDEITAITDHVCDTHLNSDYAALCRKAAAALSRKRPSPLVSGKAASWAAGIAQAMGRVNFLSDKSTQPYLAAADLAKAFGVSQATASAKSTEIWRALELMQFHPDYCLPGLIDENPYIWMLSVNGMIVDIRTMPVGAQIEAFSSGLIPYIPALKDVPEDKLLETITALLMEEGIVLEDALPPSAIYQIKITLNYLSPPIWRRVEVPDNFTLGDLHYVVQIAMGWGNAHMHEFVVGKTRYTEIDDELMPEMLDESEDEDSYTLSDVIQRKGQKLRYTYDFGDSWEHTLLVEKVLPVDPAMFYPRCTGGEHACPPDDVGGVPGYAHFVGVMMNPDDPEHAEFAEWYGKGFDPMAFDADAVNGQLLATFVGPAT